MPPRRVPLTFLGASSPKKKKKKPEQKEEKHGDCPPGHTKINPKPYCRRPRGAPKSMPKFKLSEHHTKNVSKLSDVIKRAYAKEQKKAKKHGKSFTDFSDKFVKRKDPGSLKRKRATTKKKKKQKSVWSKAPNKSFWPSSS